MNLYYSKTIYFFKMFIFKDKAIISYIKLGS